MGIMNNVKFIPTFGRKISKKFIINRQILLHLKVRAYCTTCAVKDKNEEEDETFFSKIIYNEVLQQYVAKRDPKPIKNPKPIFLKFLCEDENKVDNSASENNTLIEQNETLQFPYEVKQKFLKEITESNLLANEHPQSVDNFTPSDNVKYDASKWNSIKIKLNTKYLEKPKRWIDSHNEGLEIDDSKDVFKFGTADPNQKASKIPCGGCGALLHCSDPSLPGFIPAEIFKIRKKDELRGEICQRCHFLKEYNVSLGVNLQPSEYTKVLENIKSKEALVILMVDLLDFPCSIFPEMSGIIGSEKPLVIVGNKVDLLIQEGPLFMKNFQKAFYTALKKQNMNFKNIKYVSFISAKTGYGIEDLITNLQLFWGTKGDVYLVGCTNVGKSTLFNALIQSDYCKVKAIDIMKRATISSWPGTTLNLLKFPIMKPIDSKLIARKKRLKVQKEEEKALQTFQWMGQNIKLEQIPLQGHVGRTFGSEPEADDSLNMESSKGLNPYGNDFRKGKWFYDTPGVVHEDQIINLLTTSELLLTVPKRMLLPRNFHIKPGTSVFIAGLARLDFVSGPDFVWFTVFASMELPITVTKLNDADYVYKKLLGTSLFRVPEKGSLRLAKWPNLASKKFEIVGGQNKRNKFQIDEKNAADVDVVLSSAGWISVFVPQGYRCQLEAWTPEGRGIHLRDCPIIKRGFDFKGKKIPKTPAFEVVVREVKGRSVTDEPFY